MATCKDCLHIGICALAYTVENCPTFKNKDDYVKRERGEWKEVYHEVYGMWYYDCPLCDDGFATKERFENKPNFCQNCGADMRGSNNA